MAKQKNDTSDPEVMKSSGTSNAKPESPSTKDLLDKIARLEADNASLREAVPQQETPSTEVSQLREKTAYLEGQLALVTEQIQKTQVQGKSALTQLQEEEKAHLQKMEDMFKANDEARLAGDQLYLCELDGNRSFICGGNSPEEAEGKYKKTLGINWTQHVFQVTPLTKEDVAKRDERDRQKLLHQQAA